MKARSRLFDVIILRSWWVILVLLCSLFFFDYAYQEQRFQEDRLLIKQHILTQRIYELQQHNRQLSDELNSQSDPQWIELLLMRDLGMVPKGVRKFLIQPHGPDMATKNSHVQDDCLGP